MLNELISVVKGHVFFEILLFVVTLDTLLGVIRAMKEHKFNSSMGIDGATRKVAMLLSIIFLMAIDGIMKWDFLFMIPDQYLKWLPLNRLGICGVFCIMFLLYEAVSVLKNMVLCGLPIPAKIRIFILEFLENMTGELPDEWIKQKQEQEFHIEDLNEDEVAEMMDTFNKKEE